jgi:hypothetical protein
VTTKVGDVINQFQQVSSLPKSQSDEIIKIPAGVLPNFSGEYMIRMFYTDPTDFENWKYNDVTLATQCSVLGRNNNVYVMINYFEKSSGPQKISDFFDLTNKLSKINSLCSDGDYSYCFSAREH